MALTASTNTAANTAIRYLAQNQASASSSLTKLSSGSRIVKASDDAASLAVGTKLKADLSALKQAAVNAGQASSLLQVADGGMARIADILQRMKALSVQAESGSVTDNERAYLDKEYQALLTEVDDIANGTKFNGSALLNGTAANSVTTGAVTMVGSGANASATVGLNGAASSGAYTVTYDGTDKFTLTKPDATTDTVRVAWGAGQTVFDGTINFENAGVSISFSNMGVTDNTVSVGFTVAGGGTLSFQIGTTPSDAINVNIANVTATGLGIGGTKVTDTASASAASTALDGAISTMNASRSDLGAMLSRFEFVSANLATSVENLDAARSTLMDVDMAAEMAKFTSQQVLTQAGVAMLAQANQMPQQLLKLLQ